MGGEFDVWVRASTPWLLRAAYLLTGDQHSAEDLTQETLVKVGRAWQRIEASPEAFARRVLYREQVNRWRRRRVPEYSTARLPEVAEPDCTDAVDTRALLSAALAKLTPGQRRVVVARYFDDLTEAETATALGCSIGTVKSQTHKALQSMRALSPELADIVSRRSPADV